ncbi:hypothetical protein GCK72_009087 [Caenorhabditis remanei]|uniref:F-box domain-containing protein n=1 Tax=Caenorhabditis remanei TaxID=31234 RepID=A0A6A5H0P0_CAERE|nr:hypothetical protein GCK72_009087 [Caenorhabditis remanei]KAF1760837.1 hypothetical protein GCK72_009087 [Caenorhabditis remanei]
MGPETITLKEFEIWYNRFSRGEFDLDYDIGSNTSDLDLSNLPNDAIEKIIESCDLKEQLTLRKVSRSLRSLVDKHKVAFKSIEIYPRHSCIFYGSEALVTASAMLTSRDGLPQGAPEGAPEDSEVPVTSSVTFCET